MRRSHEVRAFHVLSDTLTHGIYVFYTIIKDLLLILRIYLQRINISTKNKPKWIPACSQFSKLQRINLYDEYILEKMIYLDIHL